MPLFETMQGWVDPEPGHRSAVTGPLANLRRNMGDDSLTEAQLLRMVAGAPDDGAGNDILQAIRALGMTGTGQDGIDNGMFLQNMGPQMETLRGAMAAPAPAAPESPAGGAPSVPGAPPLGQGHWDGNTFMPPTDPPREGMQYPNPNTFQFGPGNTPAALLAPPLPDYYGSGRLMQQMQAARPRLMGGR